MEEAEEWDNHREEEEVGEEEEEVGETVKGGTQTE